MAAVTLLGTLALSAQSTGPKREHVDGITNFTRLDVTMGCAGLTKTSAVPGLKDMGFASIVNLQRSDEASADVEGERHAATAVGLKYFHLPTTLVEQPTREQADAAKQVARRFLEIVRTPENRPAFVHCAGAGRAAALWMVKRIAIDGWTPERARAEAAVAYPGERTFVFDWAASVAAAR